MPLKLLRLAMIGAIVVSPALAQPSPAPVPNRAAPSVNPAVPGTAMPDRSGATTTNQGTSSQSTAPAPGANSFTEGQARSRMEAAGFTNVGELTKDEQGIWRGRAMRGGQQVSVMLDYQGNVTTR